MSALRKEKNYIKLFFFRKLYLQSHGRAGEVLEKPKAKREKGKRQAGSVQKMI